jgi:D-glycero-alpha-D-manno-heptose-7-phosphate kinase
VKAFLLAAGVGRRLRPITNSTPKCMLVIDDRPLLDIWLDAFDRAGVDEVLVNLHHLPHAVRRHLAARTVPPAVRTFFEPELLGSAGTLIANRRWVEREELFLACYADNLTDFDLRSLVEAHRGHGRIATLTVFHSENPSAGGVVELDAAGKVIGFVEKPSEPVSDLTNAGMYAFHPCVLDEINGTPPKDIGYDLLPRLVSRAQAVLVEGYFRDVGTAITQTPLRIGLLGGGTDLPGYYREHGGRVLNCALDKYVYVIVKQRFDDDIYVNYSKKEIVSRTEDLEHELVREAMQMTGVARGVEITTLADIPSAGSGLGSSSAVTVGLLHALYAYQGRQVAAEELAERACMIEIELCGKPIGKQDQYIAAFGGIRDIRFGPGEHVVAEELGLSAAERRALQQQIMLFYTGVTRSADSILSEQNANVEATRPQLDLLRDLAGFAVERLRSGDLDAIGPAVHESWEAKRKLASGVSTDHIDLAVNRALDAGATGVKLTGAGGGGFLLVICPMEQQRAVRQSLAHMQELPMKLDRLGSRVVLNVLRDIWG